MALKTAFLLFAIVVAVGATNVDENDPLHQKLNGDLNSVCNELLGVPCKTSPPPPSPSTPSEPPSSPPTEPPTPSEGPTPGPAPGPSPGDGVATGVIQLTLPDGVALSPAQRQALFALLQAQIAGNGVITPSPVGRKLLATENLSFTVTGVYSCAELINILDQYIQSGAFATAASAEDIPILKAILLNALCAGPNAGVASVTNGGAPTPAPAPAPARR